MKTLFNSKAKNKNSKTGILFSPFILLIISSCTSWYRPKMAPLRLQAKQHLYYDNTLLTASFLLLAPQLLQHCSTATKPHPTNIYQNLSTDIGGFHAFPCTFLEQFNSAIVFIYRFGTSFFVIFQILDLKQLLNT